MARFFEAVEEIWGDLCAVLLGEDAKRCRTCRTCLRQERLRETSIFLHPFVAAFCLGQDHSEAEEDAKAKTPEADIGDDDQPAATAGGGSEGGWGAHSGADGPEAAEGEDGGGGGVHESHGGGAEQPHEALATERIDAGGDAAGGAKPPPLEPGGGEHPPPQCAGGDAGGAELPLLEPGSGEQPPPESAGGDAGGAEQTPLEPAGGGRAEGADAVRPAKSASTEVEAEAVGGDAGVPAAEAAVGATAAGDGKAETKQGTSTAAAAGAAPTKQAGGEGAAASAAPAAAAEVGVAASDEQAPAATAEGEKSPRSERSLIFDSLPWTVVAPPPPFRDARRPSKADDALCPREWRREREAKVKKVMQRSPRVSLPPLRLATTPAKEACDFPELMRSGVSARVRGSRRAPLAALADGGGTGDVPPASARSRRRRSSPAGGDRDEAAAASCIDSARRLRGEWGGQFAAFTIASRDGAAALEEAAEAGGTSFLLATDSSAELAELSFGLPDALGPRPPGEPGAVARAAARSLRPCREAALRQCAWFDRCSPAKPLSERSGYSQVSTNLTNLSSSWWTASATSLSAAADGGSSVELDALAGPPPSRRDGPPRGPRGAAQPPPRRDAEAESVGIDDTAGSAGEASPVAGIFSAAPHLFDPLQGAVGFCWGKAEIEGLDAQPLRPQKGVPASLPPLVVHKPPRGGKSL